MGALAKGEIMAKESLKAYMVRLRQAMEDIDEEKMTKRDRERLNRKLEETEQWLKKEGFKLMQKELESAMNTIMLRINQTTSDFWEENVNLPPGEKTIENGGFFLDSGLDIRELIEDPD